MNSAGIIFEHDFSIESTDNELFCNSLGFWNVRKDEIINESSSDNKEAKMSRCKFNPNTCDSNDFNEKKPKNSIVMAFSALNNNKFNYASSTSDFDTYNNECQKL